MRVRKITFFLPHSTDAVKLGWLAPSNEVTFENVDVSWEHGAVFVIDGPHAIFISNLPYTVEV